MEFQLNTSFAFRHVFKFHKVPLFANFTMGMIGNHSERNMRVTQMGGAPQKYHQ